MGQDRLLYTIRNIGDDVKASYNNVVQAAPLRFEIADPVLDAFCEQILVEDMTIPGHANLATTSKFRPELPKILNAVDMRWHFWRADVYRYHLTLDFADKEVTGRHKKATGLRFYIKWPPELDITISLDADRHLYYHIIHLAPNKKLDSLHVEYDDEIIGMANTETYEKGPKRR